MYIEEWILDSIFFFFIWSQSNIFFMIAKKLMEGGANGEQHGLESHNNLHY